MLLTHMFPFSLINFDALPLDVNVKTLLSPGQMYLSDTNCNLELLPGVSHLLTFKPHCWFYTDADGHIHSAERSDEEMLTVKI